MAPDQPMSAQPVPAMCDTAACKQEAVEEQLAQAKAKLGKRKTATTRSPAQLAALAANQTAGPRVCRDCGVTIVRAPGQIGALPSRCTSCKAAA